MKTYFTIQRHPAHPSVDPLSQYESQERARQAVAKLILADVKGMFVILESRELIKADISFYSVTCSRNSSGTERRDPFLVK